MAMLCVVATSPAQTIRLSDVLTTGTSSQEDARAAGMLSVDEALRLAGEVRRDLETGAAARAEERARLLLNRVEAETPAHGELTLLRARALEALGRVGDAGPLARRYLQQQPDGNGAAEARRIAARAHVLAGEHADAAGHFAALMTEHADTLRTRDWIDAAQAWVHTRDAKSAREALGRATDFDSPAQRALHVYWLLESLLLEDDPQVAVPEEPQEAGDLSPAVELRRALLLELRGDEAAAVALYDELLWESGKLTLREFEVLTRRRKAHNR